MTVTTDTQKHTRGTQRQHSDESGSTSGLILAQLLETPAISIDWRVLTAERLLRRGVSTWTNLVSEMNCGGCSAVDWCGSIQDTI